MTDSYSTTGKTTIAPDVLLTIARLTTLEVPGVSRMVTPPGGVNRLLKRNQQCEGVCIEIEDDTVFLDLFVVLKNDINVRDISRKIQHAVSRSISEMVGMNVGRVNIHIEDIEYPPEPEA